VRYIRGLIGKSVADRRAALAFTRPQESTAPSHKLWTHPNPCADPDHVCASAPDSSNSVVRGACRFRTSEFPQDQVKPFHIQPLIPLVDPRQHFGFLIELIQRPERSTSLRRDQKRGTANARPIATKDVDAGHVVDI
jgi:hypothetical protein